MNTLSNEDGDKLEKASLKDSPLTKKAGRTARCEYCDKVLSSNKNLQRHIERAHLKLKEKCPDCGKSIDKAYLKLHREAVHLKKRKECQDCGLFFKITYLASHQRYFCKNKAKVICHLCGQEMLNKNLQKHIRNIHNGKVSKANVQSEYVQCDFCPKRIVKRKRNLERHQAFHRRVFIKALCV